LIEPAPAQLSLARQCELVGLPRSTYYYRAQGESPEHLLWMRLLAKQ
jgi:putative transposase